MTPKGFDPDNGPPRDFSSDDARLEQSIADYVERITHGESIDAMDVLLEHPGVGHEILECIESFIGADRIEQPSIRRLGDFKLLREIGRGGMGVVYEAHQESMDRRVALKILPAGVAADRTAFLRFLREAQTAGKLRHDAIVYVYSMGVEAETPYYAMEYIEGATLGETIAARNDGTDLRGSSVFASAEIDLAYFASAAKAFARLADGLYHAHREGVVHRDIKPSNIIVDANGSLRILDFGLAYLEDLGSLTLTGESVGTPLYMSPEQARREGIQVDHRSDIYSLGATLYEVFALQPPFRGKSREETLRLIVENDAPHIHLHEPRIPRELETIVLKCLRKEPESRYGTAQALAQDLRRFSDNEPIEARPESKWQRAKRTLRRRRTPIAAGCLIGFLVLLLALITWRQRVTDYQRLLATYDSDVLAAAGDLFASEILSESGARAVLGRRAKTLSVEDLTGMFSDEASRTLESAVNKLSRLSRDVPERVDAYYHLAKAKMLQGDVVGARAAIAKAIAHDGSFAPALALFVAPRKDAAEPAKLESLPLTISAEIGDTWQESWLSGHLAMRGGDFEAAIVGFSDLLARLMGEGEPFVGLALESHMGRGLARLRSGYYEGARQDFAASAALAPRALAPRLLLARAWGRADPDRRVGEILEDLWKLAPEFDRSKIAAFATSILSLDFDPMGALEWTQRIVDPLLRERVRASILCRQGRFGEAMVAARKALAMESSNARARRILVLTLLGSARIAQKRSFAQVSLLCEALFHAALLRANKSSTGSESARSLLQVASSHLGRALTRNYRRLTMQSRRSISLATLFFAVLLLASDRDAIAGNLLPIQDDFSDGEPFDGEPHSWARGSDFLCGGDVCCWGTYEPVEGGGVLIRQSGDTSAGLFFTEEIEGDLSVQAHIQFVGTGPVSVAAWGHYSGCISAYVAGIRSQGEIVVMHWCGTGSARNCGSCGIRSNGVSCLATAPFSPNEEYWIRLDVRGKHVRSTAWNAALGDDPPADAASTTWEDPSDAPLSRGLPGLEFFSQTPNPDDGVIVRSIRIFRPEDVSPPVVFRRGEVNGDGNVDMSDAVRILSYLFLGSPTTLSCEDAADTNDSGLIDLADGVYLLNFLFLGGPAISAPGPKDCGADSTTDDLDCGEFNGCD